MRTWGWVALLAGCPQTTPPPAPAPVTVEEPAPVVAPPVPQLPREKTPGKIQCAAATCDLASEVCCLNDGVGRCMPKAAEGAQASPCCPNQAFFCGNDSLTIERSCDEAADCGAGRRCCWVGPGEHDLAGEQCGDSCEEEVCVPGSLCPNGNACSSDMRCPLQVKPALCGDLTCELGEACCWDGKKGRCAAACNEQETTFRCTAPEQCAPYTCNSKAGMNLPFECGGGGFIGGVLCQTLEDCPEQIGALGHGEGLPRRSACVASPSSPPNVKECTYE